MNSLYLEKLEDLNAEITHFWDHEDGSFIFSTGNYFWGFVKGEEFKFNIKIGFPKNIVLSKRLLRRGTRFDKSNAIFNFKKDGIIVIYRGKVYFFCLLSKKLRYIFHLKNCRNVLHNGICVTKQGIFFGEYGANINRSPVPIYGSYNDGRNWEQVYLFQEKSIKHIHGIYFDKFTNSLFVPTGDFEKECFIVVFPDLNFSTQEILGDGSQKFRCVSMFFKKDKIIWGMDSPLETSYLQIFDRKTNKLSQGISFPGPVWYTKQFIDGSGILQTSVEVGKGVKDKYSYLFYSQDLLNWFCIAKYKKDIFPLNLFKFGVLGFSDGKQNPSRFPIHGQALESIDGKSLLFSIKKE